MTQISTVLKARTSGIGLIAGTLTAVVLSTGAFAGSAKAGVSRASTWAVQSAVRDARDQVQRRLWAHHRSYQR